MELYSEKKDCCGCAACADVCPKGAIVMIEDEYGFRYSSIDNDLCINCGACANVCPLKKFSFSIPKAAYVATNKNKEQLLKSASGGVFSALATRAIEEGWIVYGAAYELVDKNIIVSHQRVTSKSDLIKLQGSKYVQSKTDDVFSKVKNDLKNGHSVLFSGTPCQVSAIKNFVGSLSVKLFTIDIICHGVPSIKMLNNYFEMLGKKHGGFVSEFVFRDKTKGWGMTAAAQITKHDGKQKQILVPGNNSSYFNSFLKSETYRESCYSCKFASKERVGDLTIGDYWGIKEAHPEIFNKDGFFEEQGISCILVNSEKGEYLVKSYGDSLNMKLSTFEKVAKENHQLSNPSVKPSNRDDVLHTYLTEGFDVLEKCNKLNEGKKYYVNYIKAKLPIKLKKILKRMI